MKKLIIGITGAVVLAALIIFNVRSDRTKKTEVVVTGVERRDISKIITASGNIQPKRRVNVSASAMGKVTRVAVAEGDYVMKGDFLLEIDPTSYQSAVEQLTAAVRGAEAALELEEASRDKSRSDYEHALKLSGKEFVSETELRDARVAARIGEARVKSATQSLVQREASLAKAEHELAEVHISAEMSGVITALNVEEGESAIMGTLNNPGTVLLTIADLSTMEAEIRVDETEVVFVKIGQEASVTLDAFPDTSFSGVVSEVGNSAIRGSLGLGQESVDFKVVVTIQDSIPNIRPGLTASVDVTVSVSNDVLTVPIQCLTVRNKADLERIRRKPESEAATDTDESGGSDEKEPDPGGGGDGGEDEDGDSTEDDDEQEDIEGVFVVTDDVAAFTRVRVGIAGGKYFEVISGLTEGESVVSGPFEAIGGLRDGDPVKVEKERKKKDR